MRRRDRPRDRRDWRDVGEDDHFAGDAYFARWLDEPGGADDEDDVTWPRRRDVLSGQVRPPLWWRLWRLWR
jgi:hypothetical protein